jgi:hypothetical protein
MRLLLIALFISATTASTATAWNATGHRTIASITFRQLGAEDQHWVVEILRRHPRFAPDFEEPMPVEVREGEPSARYEWLFQQAAVWPDMIRFGPAEKTAFNRPEWHYINLPFFLSGEDSQLLGGKLTANVSMRPAEHASLDTLPMNIVQVIALAKRELAEKTASPAERALLLSWLFHDVGDVHQPLHSSAIYSARLFPEGDRGGNSIKTRQSRNLHALWDQFLGSDDTYRAVRNKALLLMADERLAAEGRHAALVLDSEVWARESHELAKTAAYDAEIMAALRRMEGLGEIGTIDLSESYLKRGGALAEKLVVKAGFRLAAMIKAIRIDRGRR